MKLVTGTLEEMTQLEHDIFVFGAPFRCTFFGNATYDEESESVIGSKPNGQRTVRLQAPFELEEGGGVYAIVHIDEMEFAHTTFGEYAEQFPNDQVLLSRIPQGEEYENTTPAQWVSDVIINGLFPIIDVEL